MHVFNVYLMTSEPSICHRLPPNSYLYKHCWESKPHEIWRYEAVCISDMLGHNTTYKTRMRDVTQQTTTI